MTDRPRPARRRRTPPPPPRGKREQPASRRGDRRLAQLAVSAVLLLAVVVVKITAPSAMDRYRDRLLDLMAGQTDFRAAFSAVGRAVSGQGAVGKALNDAYTAVFGPQDTGGTVPQDAADPAAYTAENTPGDVCLTQQVLGFAYANPLTGPVTDRFGYRQDPNGGGQQFHYGLDIAADEGAVITAFAAGTVTAVGDSAELGNYVTVQHPGGFVTLYADCSRINASSGQQVRPGDPIAEVGHTGNATGPHLHFELMKDGVYVNPIYYYAAPLSGPGSGCRRGPRRCWRYLCGCRRRRCWGRCCWRLCATSWATMPPCAAGAAGSGQCASPPWGRRCRWRGG